jgi:hypothetical protein
MPVTTKEMQEYVVTTPFTVGELDIKLEKGTLVTYDGYKVVVEGGDEIILPQFRGCIKAGWVKLVSDNDEEYLPQSANIVISPATPQQISKQAKTMLVSSDEQVIGLVGDRKNLRSSMNARGKKHSIDNDQSVVVTKLNNSGVVGREGEVLDRTLVSTTTLNKINREISSKKTLPSRDELLGNSDDSFESEGIKFSSTNVSKHAAAGYKPQKFSGRISTQEDAKLVGTISHIKSNRTIKSQQPNDLVDDVQIEPSKKDVRRGRKPKVDSSQINSLLSIFPELKSWDFKASVKDKQVSIKQFENNPHIIRALYQGETESFKKIIRKEYSSILE